jgi:hypothetical protein
MHPSRKKNLLCESIAGEIVVWDKQCNRAHRLNRSAGIVWQHVDGKNTAADLAAIVDRELGAGESAATLVEEALDRFAELGLLETEQSQINSRRALIRRVAVAAALIPLVASIVVPTPAKAQSGPSS